MVLSNDLAYFVYLREEPVDLCEPVDTCYRSMHLAVEGPKTQTKDTPNKLELSHHSTLRVHVRQSQPSNHKAKVLGLSWPHPSARDEDRDSLSICCKLVG
jgi:hypothetical protein